MSKNAVLAILAVALVGLGAILFLQQRQVAAERQQVAASRAEAAQAAELRRENERLSQANADAARSLSREERNELLRLRGEVTRLRQQVKQLTAAASLGQPPVPTAPAGPTPAPATATGGGGLFLPAEQWADVGLGTPEAAFQTLHWAMRHGNRERMQAAMLLPVGSVPEGTVPIGLDMLSGDGAPAGAGAFTQATTTALSELTGSRIVSQQEVSPEEVQLIIENQHADGTRLPAQMQFRRVGSEWKLAPTVVQWAPASSQDVSPP